MTHIMWVIFVFHCIDDVSSPTVVFNLCVMEWFHVIQHEDHSRTAVVIPEIKNCSSIWKFLFIFCEFIKWMGGVKCPKIITSKYIWLFLPSFDPRMQQRSEMGTQAVLLEFLWIRPIRPLLRPWLLWLVRIRDPHRKYHLSIPNEFPQKYIWKNSGNHRKTARFLFHNVLDVRFVSRFDLFKIPTPTSNWWGFSTKRKFATLIGSFWWEFFWLGTKNAFSSNL